MKRKITEGIHASNSKRYIRNKPPAKPEPVYHVPDLEGEIWKDIEGFEGLYAVSNMGRIKSLDKVLPHKRHGTWHIKERVLKPGYCGPSGTQYQEVYLHVGSGNMVGVKIHRAVAETFVPNPENKPQVNHIDGNKDNNRADNLEWVTAQENVDHAWSHGLCANVGKTNEHPVMCVETGTVYPSIAAAETLHAISKSAIGHAIRRGSTSAGYHWQYADQSEGNDP